jgi:hypothetical protein
MPISHYLYQLLQFESFQDGIRYYIYKAGENRIHILTYAIVATIVLTLLYSFLARRK